jgi:sterol desaturase/sphingolipid hydroxylase (fatty acid hydroxylase superfamily)
MQAQVMEHELIIRLGVFLGLFGILALAELWRPRRPAPRTRRWVLNWGLILLDSLALRLMAVAVPLLAVGAALDASQRGVGLLNHISLNGALETLIAILILDFAIWFQHLLTHKIPMLWRLHQVHHSDPEMDVTTAIRFHPFEILLSMVLKIGLVYALGASAFSVVLFEVLLNGTALFNHANIRLPLALDRVLRRVLVTPDMHRVHHSTNRDEHDSNYGFSLAIWDRIFGTYIAQPREGHEGMTIGLTAPQARPNTLSQVLTMPFRKLRK